MTSVEYGNAGFDKISAIDPKGVTSLKLLIAEDGRFILVVYGPDSGYFYFRTKGERNSFAKRLSIEECPVYDEDDRRVNPAFLDRF